MARQQKTHAEKVVGAVGKRPQSAADIGRKLGFKTHHGVSKALGDAVKSGTVVRGPKGYSKA